MCVCVHACARARVQDDQGPTADWANAYAEPWIYEGTPAQALAKIKFQVQRLGLCTFVPLNPKPYTLNPEPHS